MGSIPGLPGGFFSSPGNPIYFQPKRTPMLAASLKCLLKGEHPNGDRFLADSLDKRCNRDPFEKPAVGRVSS